MVNKQLRRVRRMVRGISMSPSLYAALDEAAIRLNLTRSEAMREAVHNWLVSVAVDRPRTAER